MPEAGLPAPVEKESAAGSNILLENIAHMLSKCSQLSESTEESRSRDGADLLKALKNLVELIERRESLDLDQTQDPWNSISKMTRERDVAKIDGWNKDLDGLLVYAALFSAIIAAFNIEFYKTLVRGFATNTSTTSMSQLASHMERANMLLFAIATGNTSRAYFEPSVTTTDVEDVAANNKAMDLPLVYNSLWFLSLVFALIAASLATLVKQWLLRYLDQDFNSSPREHLRLRRHRYKNLTNSWGIPMIIGMLPVLLRISFILFLMGLMVELYVLRPNLMFVVSAFSGIWVSISAFFIFAPAIWPYCPFKSPESLLFFNIYILFGYVFDINTGVPDSDRIRWRSWKDQEKDLIAASGEEEELDLELLVEAAKDLAFSGTTLANDIEGCARSFKPSQAILLVDRIAYQQMYTASSTSIVSHTGSLLCRDNLWDLTGQYPEPDKVLRYQRITGNGTRALINIAIDAFLRTSDTTPRDKIIALSKEVLPCIATLVRYAVFVEPPNFLPRLQLIVGTTFKQFGIKSDEWSPDQNQILFSLFVLASSLLRRDVKNVIIFSWHGGPQPELSSRVADWILKSASSHSGQIYQYVFGQPSAPQATSEEDLLKYNDPGLIFYTIMTLVISSKPLDNALRDPLNELFSFWVAGLESGFSRPPMTTKWAKLSCSVITSYDKIATKLYADPRTSATQSLTASSPPNGSPNAVSHLEKLKGIFSNVTEGI